MWQIHPTAAKGFSAGAASYVAGRPDYPAALNNWLVQELGLDTNKKVLDLGAGTGKFTRSLLATGATVSAVEPVPAMLEQLERHYPSVDAKRGTAEQIPYADATFDAVICAQCFHWFATPVALKEIHRVLKPGGALGLVWNVRDDQVPWVAQLTAIMKPFEGDAPRYHSQQWRRLFPADGFSTLREQQFHNSHTGPAEHVILDRILSVSFMAALSPAKKEKVRRQIQAVIAKSPELAGKAEVTFPYETKAFACHTLP